MERDAVALDRLQVPRDNEIKGGIFAKVRYIKPEITSVSDFKKVQVKSNTGK